MGRGGRGVRAAVMAAPGAFTLPIPGGSRPPPAGAHAARGSCSGILWCSVHGQPGGEAAPPMRVGWVGWFGWLGLTPQLMRITCDDYVDLPWGGGSVLSSAHPCHGPSIETGFPMKGNIESVPRCCPVMCGPHILPLFLCGWGLGFGMETCGVVACRQEGGQSFGDLMKGLGSSLPSEGCSGIPPPRLSTRHSRHRSGIPPY